MRFTEDTSQLESGRWYWCAYDAHSKPFRARYQRSDAGYGLLWGAECPYPTVEVEPAPAEPERPAWVPPVCPAGQAYLVNESTGRIALVGCDTPMRNLRYPKPAWPPRIGEIVEVLPGQVGDYDDVSAAAFVPAEVLSGPCEYEGGEGVLTAFGIMWREEEGRSWRWVYRDLSDYTPPGGSNV